MAPTEARAPDTVTVAIPDLSAFASPLAKAEILLQSAAEVEHALMVQYLYATYSLKVPREVTDAAQKAVLNESSAKGWPQVLLGIAREEMGHLMTVQNMLLLLGLAPNFEREDFPPRKDLYPFALHLEPLSQQSLAKYVVAEAPSGAADIDDIVVLASETAHATINRVGVLYGLLGLVLATEDQVEPGASGDPEWDAIVRGLAAAAHQQAPPDAWHLADGDFHPESLARQADPQDWQVADLRVHRMADRAAAVQAIRDIGEQGEGPTTADELSHFARFRGIFRGADGAVPFPAPGAWVPTRNVPTDPRVQDIADPRTRRWAELGDLRYGLLLGFLEHYLVTPDDDRSVLVGWIFAEMRSRLGYIARELTRMPRTDAGGGEEAATAVPGGVAAIAFTLPAQLHLPADEPARWDLHRERTEAAIAKVQEMQAADAKDGQDPYLADTLASDRARLALMTELTPARPIPTSFARDILPLFRPKDVQHMSFQGVDLRTYDRVKDRAEQILERVRATPQDGQMPPPTDQRWTTAQTDLLARWIAEGSPP
ncbi:MAG: ferritin-like protein [Actinomycetota bacterium]|nr:ferritin-like protein [Actinomycetota bacterium]